MKQQDVLPPVMLEFTQATKTYQGKAGEVQALDGLSFAVKKGESVALIGPSGCGKSTALLLAAGLLKPDEGSVTVEGAHLDKPRLQTGLILQDYGLLPWKTVAENAGLGLRIRKLARAEREKKTQQALLQVGLEEFANNYPSELSGGMRQRLALARVLALDIDLLLMDEPLSALDLELREGLQDLLLGMWQTKGYTQVFVTHSIDEAVCLGERILVMSPRPGRIIAEIPNPRITTKDYRLMPEFFNKTTEVRSALKLSGRIEQDGQKSTCALSDVHTGTTPEPDAQAGGTLDSDTHTEATSQTGEHHGS